MHSNLTCLCSLYSVLSKRLHCILTVGASFTLLDWYVSSVRMGHPIASVMRKKSLELSETTRKPLDNQRWLPLSFTKMIEGIVLIVAV